MNRFLHFLLTCVIFLTACQSSVDDETPVTIAISPWAGYSFAVIAKELGYFRINDKEQIHLAIYPSLIESRRAYANGNVNGMFSTMIEVIESIQQENKTPNILMVTNFSNGPDQILAKKDIKNLYELKGKRIGVENSSIGLYLLNRALEIHKIPYNEYSLVFLSSDKMQQALADNIIDAAISYPPYTQGIRSLAPSKIFDSSKIQDEIIDLLVVDQHIAQTRSKQLRLFIKGWIRAYEYYQKHPEQATRLLLKSPEFSNINLAEELNNLSLPNYYDQSRLFADNGELNKSFNNITLFMSRHKLIVRNIRSQQVVDGRILKLYPIQ